MDGAAYSVFNCRRTGAEFAGPGALWTITMNEAETVIRQALPDLLKQQVQLRVLDEPPPPHDFGSAHGGVVLCVGDRATAGRASRWPALLTLKRKSKHKDVWRFEFRIRFPAAADLAAEDYVLRGICDPADRVHCIKFTGQYERPS